MSASDAYGGRDLTPETAVSFIKSEMDRLVHKCNELTAYSDLHCRTMDVIRVLVGDDEKVDFIIGAVHEAYSNGTPVSPEAILEQYESFKSAMTPTIEIRLTSKGLADIVEPWSYEKFHPQGYKGNYHDVNWPKGVVELNSAARSDSHLRGERFDERKYQFTHCKGSSYKVPIRPGQWIRHCGGLFKIMNEGDTEKLHNGTVVRLL